MSVTIGSQVGAQRGAQQIAKQDRQLQLTLARLASAQRITTAADDPAGQIVAAQMGSQLASLAQVSNGLETDVGLAQVADGALSQTSDLLQRQRAIAVQAGNDAVLDPAARAALDRQFQELGKAIDSVAAGARFGSTPLLDGSVRQFTAQTGTQAGQTDALTIASTLGAKGDQGFDRAGLGLNGAGVGSADDATATLDRLDAALAEVNRQRGDIGAFQANTLESGLRSMADAGTNLTAAQSVITDTDYAQESANQMRDALLAQTGLALQVQRGLSAENVLRLLGT